MLALIGIWVMIFAFGRLFRWPAALRWGLAALAYFAALGAAAALPEGNGLRAALGGGPMPLAILGGTGALVAGYTFGLRRLRARARDVLLQGGEAEGPRPSFSDTELERYARHIVLREIGGAGQKRLKDGKVLIVGAGGLGSPAMMYLAAAGLGTIGVIDDDVVDNSNMQRQVIHRDEMIGQPKVHSACETMRAINPYITARAYHRRLDAETARALFAEYDVILDGSDNFETRYLVNEAAVHTGKPLISGAMAQWEGQLSIFEPSRGAPCYACVFPEEPAAGLAPSCSEAGVAGPLPGIIGSMMALEALKLIAGAGTVMRGEMLIFDGLYGESRKMRLKRRAGCAVCGKEKSEG